MEKLEIGMLKAMAQCSGYRKMSPEKRKELQLTRLRRLVEWARENSPYYSQLYQGTDKAFRLQDLPPVNKAELMAHWDEWVTDRTLSLAQVNEFMKEPDNIGRRLQGRYLVFTTSGSTGEPMVTLCDSTANNVMGAVNAVRSIARKEDLLSFIRHGGKTIGVFATGGFYLGNSSVRSRLLSMPWKKKQIAVTSALLPLTQIVEELNRFQPAMLGGYPSNLELLIDEQKCGRLMIHPVLIMTGGEYLSDSLRKRLSEAFCCYVQTSYSCTEGGTVACECTEQHFHINDDWVIAEPVDRNNRPVPCGVQADKLLLTSLFHYTQPFIRYEITDRVVMHDEPCPCGNPSPWLTVEGRTDDVISFFHGGHEIRIPPLAIYATLKEVHELRRFQLLACRDNLVKLRICPTQGIDRHEAFLKAKTALAGFFSTHGLEQAEILLSEEEPRQDAGSGKYKHIIKVE